MGVDQVLHELTHHLGRCAHDSELRNLQCAHLTLVHVLVLSDVRPDLPPRFHPARSPPPPPPPVPLSACALGARSEATASTQATIHARQRWDRVTARTRRAESGSGENRRERRVERHAPLLVELGLLLVTRRRAHERLLTTALHLGVHDGSPQPLATLGAAGALRSTGSPPPLSLSTVSRPL